METKVENNNQVQNSNLEGVNEMEMANKAYTKEMLNDFVSLLDIETEIIVKENTGVYSVIFTSKDGFYRNVQVDLKLDLDIEKTYAYRNRHPESAVYNIIGFELSVISLRTISIDEAKYLLTQYKDSMKVAKLFEKIANSDLVLIENY